MGNFYVNVTTKGPGQLDVINYLKDKGYTAYVSPTINNVTTIYEMICDTQLFEYISNLLKDISSSLNCISIGMVDHDDDLLAYEIYENGKMHHEYDSSPGYFKGTDIGPPIGGDAKYLCKVFGAEGNESRVEEILRAPSGDENGYIFQVDRHKDLWEALNLPPFAVGVGYNYISEGDLPEDLKSEEFTFIKK